MTQEKVGSWEAAGEITGLAGATSRPRNQLAQEQGLDARSWASRSSPAPPIHTHAEHSSHIYDLLQNPKRWMTCHRGIFSFCLRHRHGFLSPASDSEPSVALDGHIFYKSARFSFFPCPPPTPRRNRYLPKHIKRCSSRSMEKKWLFFQFVWTGAARISGRTAPLCSPLLTDSPSQEARGLYARPQKVLNPQGRPARRLF